MNDRKESNAEIVFNVLSKSAKPMTAYQILEKLIGKKISGPPTVYRALDKLQALGKVHRIESKNAFVICNHPENKAHTFYFVICNDCGEIEEIHDEKIEATLKEWSDKFKFLIMQQTIELVGLCFRCNSRQSVSI